VRNGSQEHALMFGPTDIFTLMVKMLHLDLRTIKWFYHNSKRKFTPSTSNRARRYLNDAIADHDFLDQEGSQHLKYRESLIPKSSLGETWYGSWGIHVLGAPIR
jgi:hypothetical protein